MKKLLLLVTLILLSVRVSAQCTPDPQYTSPGIHPDSAAGFSDACVNVPYTQLITNVVPADTQVVVFGIPVTTSIDSIVIDSLHGMPPGMTLGCHPSGCAYQGGTTGCAVISGTCSVAGNYPLTFYLSAYVGGVTTPHSYVVGYYSIKVHSSPCTSGLTEEELTGVRILQNQQTKTITVKGLNAESVSLVNTEGKTLKENQVSGLETLEMSVADLNTGFYFIRIYSKTGQQVFKVIL